MSMELFEGVEVPEVEEGLVVGEKVELEEGDMMGMGSLFGSSTISWRVAGRAGPSSSMEALEGVGVTSWDPSSTCLAVMITKGVEALGGVLLLLTSWTDPLFLCCLYRHQAMMKMI